MKGDWNYSIYFPCTLLFYNSKFCCHVFFLMPTFALYISLLLSTALAVPSQNNEFLDLVVVGMIDQKYWNGVAVDKFCWIRNQAANHVRFLATARSRSSLDISCIICYLLPLVSFWTTGVWNCACYSLN